MANSEWSTYALKGDVRKNDVLIPKVFHQCVCVVRGAAVNQLLLEEGEARVILRWCRLKHGCLVGGRLWQSIYRISLHLIPIIDFDGPFDQDKPLGDYYGSCHYNHSQSYKDDLEVENNDTAPTSHR